MNSTTLKNTVRLAAFLQRVNDRTLHVFGESVSAYLSVKKDSFSSKRIRNVK